jgi:D-aminopeptidase
MGSTQIRELGEIETPILLTNTLAVPRAADALLDWTLAQPGNAEVRSINMVVGETNDGYLNNIRNRVLTADVIKQAIEVAKSGPVAEGTVGAGTGTVAFGWKGGIGTSSRSLPPRLGGYTVGVLVQSNYGGVLQIAGLPVGQRLDQYYLRDELGGENADGSIMIVVATDAPLSDRNLTRLAHRGLAGLARTGAAMSNGSGDYVIAFSTDERVRRRPMAPGALHVSQEVPNDQLSPLFQAVIEATEEAIYNSLCMATTVSGYQGRVVRALPIKDLLTVFDQSVNRL